MEYQVANINRPIWQGPGAPVAQGPAPATQPLGGSPLGASGIPQYPYYQPMMIPAPPPMAAPTFTMPSPWQTPSYLANSVPMASPWELPRPEQLAPELFMPPHTHGVPGYPMPTAYNTTNNFNIPGPNGMAYNPAGQPLGQPMPPQPPAQTPPPETPAPPPPAEAPVAPPKAYPVLNSQTLQELQTSLSSTDVDARMRGAIRLSKMMEGDPNMLANPNTKAYGEALILKALKDPSSLVRQPILLAMELGYLNNPTPKIINLLKAVKGEQGLYNFEPGIIDNVLGGLKAKWQASQQAFAGTPAAAGANPAAVDLGAAGTASNAAATVTPTGVAPGVAPSNTLRGAAAQQAYANPSVGGPAHV